MARQINDEGIDLIKSFEAVKARAYLDPVNILTVGVGHVVKPEENIKLGQVISTQRINELLQSDLKEATDAIEQNVTAELNDNEFAALTSLAFNIGANAFKKSSLVKALNRGDFTTAAAKFLEWNKAKGKVLPGLTRRRKAEKKLFETEPKSYSEVTKVTETAVVTDATKDKTTETTVEKTSIISSDKVKEIASTGLSNLGTKLTTSGVSAGVLSGIGAFLEKNWMLLVLAVVFLTLAGVLFMVIYKTKHNEKIVEAQINTDPDRPDVKFLSSKTKEKQP